ncbi:MAG: high-affinity methionine permease [Olpidium bornovanus]|uniref:High-affinity methionine permease n=1 Tax=Olpidium bornovanus TaxID=278681 RepID=A0A8H7ZT79_9FUNG|nr:MAG: high-affinity methionine permease [Olpidium bornovanus]
MPKDGGPAGECSCLNLEDHLGCCEKLQGGGGDAGDSRRTLGLVSFLIVNRMLGTGIFATPANILLQVGSVGMALILWITGALIAVAGLLGMGLYVEYGTGLPKSGGEKNYLEFVYRKPRLLATCVYASNALFLGWAGSNSVGKQSVSASGAAERFHFGSAILVRPSTRIAPSVFGEYVLFAAGLSRRPDDPQDPFIWKSRTTALACVTFAFLIHSLFPKSGMRLQNLLGGLKILILVFVVASGFAAMGGMLQVEPPNNYVGVFEGTSTSAYSYASALFMVIWSFIGYSNANYVLGEVKNPVRTMKRAGPLAVGIVSVLYLLANVAYFAAVSKEEMKSGGVVIAGRFFANVYGAVIGRRILPVFVALSAMGNVLAVMFAHGRINQELGKEGILPFSPFWASSWPLKTPFSGLFLHWAASVVMILGPPEGDAYTFILDVISYPVSIINAAIAAGLLLIRAGVLKYDWSPPFRCPVSVAGFFLCANIFLVVLPLVPPPGLKGDTSLPYYLYCVIGAGILLAGAAYWWLWTRLWPLLCGFAWERRQGQLADGTRIWEYVKVRAER